MRHRLVFVLIVWLASSFPISASGQTSGPAAANLRVRLVAIQQRLPAFGKQLTALQTGGQDVSYPRITFTVLNQFVPYALEDLDSSVPSGWGLMPVNGFDASFEPVHDAHSGAWAARVIARSPAKPNVYAMIESQAVISLSAGKPYTLSLWTKSDHPGAASMTLNTSWSNRLTITPTGGKWERISKTFRPAAADCAFKPRVLAESAGELLIDDVQLVQGTQAETGKNLIPNPSFEISWTQQRVAREIGDMESMAGRLDAELHRAAAGELTFPPVPRWTGAQRPVIQGPSFIGPERLSSAAGARQQPPVRRPIFFIGYGHFQQVRHDIELFPAYGINIVQHGEFGPSAVFPKEHQTSDDAIDRLIDELDRAARAGVAVDWLLSPHYVPDWLLAKYPHLRKARADFFPYSIYAPQGRELVQKFIRYVLPKIKDKPALLSICLSNEPINVQEPDEYSTASWHAWLKQHHHDIATLNARWGSHYGSFDAIAEPNALGPGTADQPRPGPEWADFCRWNDESFAEFHKLLADTVHEIAPEIPVHIKATTWHMYRPEEIQSGDDPTLLDNVGQINGNDSVNLWSFKQRAGDLIERGTRDFAQGWRENALAYELQRSTHDAPVFNSENHLIFDRETRYVSPAHIRAALWMGAIHGQSATTLWVWERETSNPRGDFAGDIMERAGCAEAVGIVNCDLNRVAPAITAIQNAPADVLLLQDNSAAVWDGKKYGDALVRTFTALSFTGLKIGFLTERQLETKTIAQAPLLIVPDCVHLSDAAFAHLADFKGKILFVGDVDLLSKNEYGHDRTDPLPADRMLAPMPLPKTWQETLESLRPRLDYAGAAPAIKVLDEMGKPQSAVQWQLARTPQGLIVNLYNASHDPLTITLAPPAPAVDLLTNESLPVGEKITLQPMDVRPLQMNK